MTEDWVPSTDLLWGEFQNLTMESVIIQAATGDTNSDTLNCVASTSQGPNTIDSEIDSHEFEWDSLSDATMDLEIDVIQSYSAQPDVVDKSSVGLADWTPWIALVDDTSLGRTTLDSGILEGDLMNSEYMVTRNDTHHIHNIEPVIDLPIVHRDLIDWSQAS